MNYLNTSDLRKKTLVLRDSLKRGESVYLLHRSKVIGIVEPYEQEPKVATLAQLRKVVALLSTGKKISYTKRKEIYLKHLTDKYGKDIS